MHHSKTLHKSVSSPSNLKSMGNNFSFVLLKGFGFAHTGSKTRLLPEGEKVNSLEVANLKLFIRLMETFVF